MTPFPKGQFGVICADNPWKYKMYSDKGHAKGAEAQYPTMTFDELAAMRDDILFAAAPNSVLFMWTTWAADYGTDHLQQAMDLMRIWGFQRKTGGHWTKLTKHGKQAFGTGYIMRSADEPFIIGTIGEPKIKNHSTRNQIFTGDVPENLCDLGMLIAAQAREHSRKPDEVPIMLENLFDGPYLELFARTTRQGWTSWGNEINKFGGDNA